MEFLFYVIMVATGAFGYVTYKNHELPQQTWQRLVSMLRGSPEPTPPPILVQQPTPTQESSPNPAPEPTMASAATPPPPADPFAWLIARRNRWPEEVTLLETQNFPAVSNGKVVGSVAVPANSTVTLAEIVQPDVVIVVASSGGEKKLPAKATNLLELAKREMQRPEPTPTPQVAVAIVQATPTPTPFKGFENDSDTADKGPPADRTLTFETSAPGVDKSIKTWGMGTIGGPPVMQSGITNMGADQIDVVIMPFPIKDPLTESGELSPGTKAMIDADLATAKLAGYNKPLIISVGVGGPDPVNPWYLLGPNRVNPARWADCVLASMKYIKRSVAWVQVFNEPDFGPWGQGSQKDLNDILGRLRGDSAFRSTQLAGPAVLNVDWGVDWYNAIKSRVSIGTTHALNGSFDSYVNFLNAVRNNGQTSFCPELHNVGEAIIGAEYGLGGGIWWLGCGVERGSFVKACQGKRLGYAEHRPKWTAAAVYRAPDGKVQAFLGASERNAQKTTYRFVCRDREVYFNGEGPSKEHTVTIDPNQEKAINITWSH